MEKYEYISSKRKITGDVAVVTGSAGIGLGVALKLEADGFYVILCGNNLDHNEAALLEFDNKKAEVVFLDVSDKVAVKKFSSNLANRTNSVRALVNCAAIQPYGNIETTSPEEWENTIKINLSGYYLMSHYLYPLIKASKSASIVNIASVQGHCNQKNVLAYATSKGAIHALTRAMAVDCAADNVKVNSISPGSIRTPLLEFAAKELTKPRESIEGKIEEFGKAHALGRVGTVEEIASLVSFLVGNDSGFCTGGDIAIDGGLRAQLGV